MEITPQRLAQLRETGFVLADKAAGYNDEQVKAHLAGYRKQAAARSVKAAGVRTAILESQKE